MRSNLIAQGGVCPVSSRCDGGRQHRLLALLVGALCVLIKPARVEGQPEQPLAFSGQIELVHLLDLAAEQLAVNIEYDPAAISGTVTLRTGAGVGEGDLWDLLNRSLAVRSLTTIRVGAAAQQAGGETDQGQPSYAVVRIADAATLAPRETLGPGGDPAPGQAAGGPVPGYRVVVMPLVHQPAAALTEALSPILSRTGGSVTALAPAGPLVIADLSPRVAEALSITRAMDVPTGSPRMVEVPLRTLSGAQMVALVEQVVTRRDAVTGRPLIGDVLVSPDGGAVLVVAPEAVLTEWTGLIEALDRRQGVETVTYTPRYFAASDVGGLIGQTVADATDDRWRMVVDSLTGSLVITATPVLRSAVAWTWPSGTRIQCPFLTALP